MKGVGVGFRHRRPLVAREQWIAGYARRGRPHFDDDQMRPAEEPFTGSASGSGARGGLP